MSESRFRVGFMGRPMHPSFRDTAAKNPALEVVTMEIERPEAEIAAMLAAAMGITPARRAMNCRGRGT